jgi:hypothetical protein
MTGKTRLDRFGIEVAVGAQTLPRQELFGERRQPTTEPGPHGRAEPTLAAPGDRGGEVSGHGPAQEVLLATAPKVEPRRNLSRQLDELVIEEGHAGLKAERHRHAVEALGHGRGQPRPEVVILERSEAAGEGGESTLGSPFWSSEAASSSRMSAENRLRRRSLRSVQFPTRLFCLEGQLQGSRVH